MKELLLAFLKLISVFLFNKYMRTNLIDKYGNKKGNKYNNYIYDVGLTYIPVIEFKDKKKKFLFGHFRNFISMFPLIMAFFSLNMTNKINFINDLSIIYFTRVIFNCLTVLPSIDNCGKKDTDLVNGCCDCMFSGHTAACIIGTLYYIYYNNKVCKKTNIILLILNIFNSYIQIANRRHYTDDVLMSWFIVFTVFFIRTNNPRDVLKVLLCF